MKYIRVPIRYVPKQLTQKDRQKQIQMLMKSKKLYNQHKYVTRKRLASYKNKPSNHIQNARRIYGIKNITPNKELARKTGCSLSGLNQIVAKGEGAYYSSGSRPNQTAKSWGLARLASAITSGKSAIIDYSILKKECNHKKRAFILANKSVKKYKNRPAKTVKIRV